MRGILPYFNWVSCFVYIWDVAPTSALAVLTKYSIFRETVGGSVVSIGPSQFLETAVNP